MRRCLRQRSDSVHGAPDGAFGWVGLLSAKLGLLRVLDHVELVVVSAPPPFAILGSAVVGCGVCVAQAVDLRVDGCLATFAENPVTQSLWFMFVGSLARSSRGWPALLRRRRTPIAGRPASRPARGLCRLSWAGVPREAPARAAPPGDGRGREADQEHGAPSLDARHVQLDGVGVDQHGVRCAGEPAGEVGDGFADRPEEGIQALGVLEGHVAASGLRPSVIFFLIDGRGHDAVVGDRHFFFEHGSDRDPDEPVEAGVEPGGLLFCRALDGD